MRLNPFWVQSYLRDTVGPKIAQVKPNTKTKHYSSNTKQVSFLEMDGRYFSFLGKFSYIVVLDAWHWSRLSHKKIRSGRWCWSTLMIWSTPFKSFSPSKHFTNWLKIPWIGCVRLPVFKCCRFLSGTTRLTDSNSKSNNPSAERSLNVRSISHYKRTDQGLVGLLCFNFHDSR